MLTVTVMFTGWHRFPSRKPECLHPDLLQPLDARTGIYTGRGYYHRYIIIAFLLLNRRCLSMFTINKIQIRILFMFIHCEIYLYIVRYIYTLWDIFIHCEMIFHRRSFRCVICLYSSRKVWKWIAKRKVNL